MRWHVSGQDRKANVGDLGDKLQQVDTQLDGRVTLVVSPAGGLTLGGQRRIGVLAAAQGAVTLGLRTSNILVINMPAISTTEKNVHEMFR